MNAVIDTNIFISSIFWNGSPYEVVQAWMNEKFSNVSSEEIIEEVHKTLVDFEIQLPTETIQEWVSYIRENSIIVICNNRVSISRDKKDDKIIEAAIAGDAKYIITGDKDLLVIRRYDNIEIVNAADFLKILNTRE